MFLAAIIKEHAGSAAAEPQTKPIAHDKAQDKLAHEDAMTVEVTGVVAVPEDFLGAPAVARAAPADRRRDPRKAPATRSRWV